MNSSSQATASLDITRRVAAINSVETEAFKKRFLALSIGDLVSRSEAVAISGGRRINYGAIQTATKQVRREAEIVIGCVIGQGWKRLNPSEASATADRSRQRIRRIAKTTREVLTTVPVEQLPESERTTHHVRSTVMALLEYSTQTKQSSGIERRIANSGTSAPLVLAETLRALQSA